MSCFDLCMLCLDLCLLSVQSQRHTWEAKRSLYAPRCTEKSLLALVKSVSVILSKHGGTAAHLAGEVVDSAVPHDGSHEEQSERHGAMDAAVSMCQRCLHATAQHLHRCTAHATITSMLTACRRCMSQHCMHLFMKLKASSTSRDMQASIQR